MEVGMRDLQTCVIRSAEAFLYQAVRWEVDAIITDVTKTWLDMRAALNGTSGRGQITQRADSQFRRLQQSWRTVQALFPLDWALVLFSGPVWLHPLNQAQIGEGCRLV